MPRFFEPLAKKEGWGDFHVLGQDLAIFPAARLRLLFFATVDRRHHGAYVAHTTERSKRVNANWWLWFAFQ